MRHKFSPSSLAQSFERRSFLVGGIQGGIGLLLAARMGYIAVAENERYEMEAESNRVRLIRLFMVDLLDGRSTL